MPDFDFSDIFDGDSSQDREQYTNPFYGIPMQYLPLNIDGMFQWSDHFLIRFGFYRNALQRISNYFITSLNVDCDDDESKKEYKKIFEKLRWKQILSESGLSLLSNSNLYISVNQGFKRFLICPKCAKVTVIDRVHNFKFQDKGKYIYKCPNCNYNGEHRKVDKTSRDPEEITVINWPAREVKVKYDKASKKGKYYWDIPDEYKTQVTAKGDKFFPKVVPGVIYDAIFQERMVEFNSKNFIHIKLPTPAGLYTDGRAIPLCIYLFDSFFMLKVLERFNEAICYEDINPFRVFAMAADMNAANPMFNNMEGGEWAAAIDEMIDQHRRDPGGYCRVPFNINYQQIGGDGKNLAPTDLMNYAVQNILNALNIPQELYTMTLQTQAVGPALRLFENSWGCLVDAYNEILQHIADVVSKIRGLVPAKVSLLEITFADDMERKGVIGQLVSANAIARSELLNLYNFDYKDQIRKKMEEDLAAQELQEEEQERQQIMNASKNSIFNQQQPGAMGMAQLGGDSGQGGPQIDNASMTPDKILEIAQEEAQRLQPMSASDRRTELQKIKASNETLWGAVKSQLGELDEEAKSQGLQQAKQQGQQQ